MLKVSCPNCNQRVSAKALKCEHCGFDLAHTISCPRCGALVKDDIGFCPQCGCTLDEEYYQPFQHWRAVISIILAVVIIAAGFIGYGAYKNHKMAVYYDAIDEAISTRSQCVGTLKDCAALLMDVWQDAILQEYNENTAPYTCPDGEFVKDFNVALDNLYQDESFAKKVEFLNRSQSRMLELRAILEASPKDEEDANTYIISLIDNFVDSTAFVLTPSGNIFDVKERFKELIEEGNSLSNQLGGGGW